MSYSWLVYDVCACSCCCCCCCCCCIILASSEALCCQEDQTCCNTPSFPPVPPPAAVAAAMCHPHQVFNHHYEDLYMFPWKQKRAKPMTTCSNTYNLGVLYACKMTHLLLLLLLLLLCVCTISTGVQSPLRRPVHVPLETETSQSNDARKSAGMHACQQQQSSVGCDVRVPPQDAGPWDHTY